MFNNIHKIINIATTGIISISTSEVHAIKIYTMILGMWNQHCMVARGSFIEVHTRFLETLNVQCIMLMCNVS